MSEYAKELPPGLRNSTATSSAQAHQGLGATSSTSRSGPATSFRTGTASDSADRAFDAFAQGPSATIDAVSGGSRPRRASSIIVSSWTGEDLEPRAGDGQAVLDLLASSTSPEDLDESLDELTSRRQQDWQKLADNAVPIDPASSHPLSKDAYPYLFNLLSLPEDQSISTYLDMTSYTDDVWALPASLKQDLDQARGVDRTSEDATQRALGRLRMLRQHLQAKASEQSLPEQATISTQDWDRIWQMRLP